MQEKWLLLAMRKLLRLVIVISEEASITPILERRSKLIG